MMVCRYLSIMFFWKVLKKYGYGFTHVDAIVLTYGGIRGAIGISFALIVQHDKFFHDDFKHTMLLHMAGVVMLTLLSK
jgi:NhaP-type Na+/H+ or K+/H+ antiporter